MNAVIGYPRQFLFVGESRSRTAIEKGWTWRDGRLAAKTLHAALRGIGVDPLAQDYTNVWPDPPRPQTPTRHRVRALRATNRIVVALGSKVARELTALGIAHVALIHPAARGKIRGRGRYAAHVANKIAMALTVRA